MIRAIRRAAFVGVAALAGVLGLSGIQARAIARTNVEGVRQAERAGLPVPSSVPTSRIGSAQSVANRASGGLQSYSYGNAIWVGYMRGSGSKWTVGRRGGKRMRGAGVRV